MGEGPANAGNREAWQSKILPARRWTKAFVSKELSTSSMTTRSSACNSSIVLSNCSEKSRAALALLSTLPLVPAPASVGEPRSSSRASKPSQKNSASLKRPSPKTMSLTPFALAITNALLSGSGLATATKLAAEAGTLVALNRACIAETPSPPANIRTFMRQTVHGSCSDDKTSGKGNETPSSGNINQDPCAPSTSTRGAPFEQETNLPTTSGSS
mmetsp:Transcript_70070/g.200806  ORF Transcript_70070/g.200806 Transcript_70070/m.200806 type:complete len:215 (+) Transcript_70070:549-1193(+)